LIVAAGAYSGQDSEDYCFAFDGIFPRFARVRNPSEVIKTLV
jgi:hypothetical protein